MSDPEKRETVQQSTDPGVPTGAMHQNVPDWNDPECACEAEPYWRALDKDQREEVLDEDTTDPTPD